MGGAGGGMGGAGGGMGGAGGGMGGMSPTGPTSCQAPGGTGGGPSTNGIDDCGKANQENCCLSYLVKGGTFYRKRAISLKKFEATVSDFKMDRFEVTVGRFRRFLDVVVNQKPVQGSGKHTHLAAGKGLTRAVAPLGGGGMGGAPPAAHEDGWQSAWDNYLPASKAIFDADQQNCAGSTWTPTAGTQEDKAMNCVNWFEAYAFCIYDGGFLPSEAEWEYAASNGKNARYPWGDVGDPVKAVVNTTQMARVGSLSSQGDTKANWALADMTGNAREWVLDWLSEPFIDWNESAKTANCIDCAHVALDAMGTNRVLRGGSFQESLTAGQTSNRVGQSPLPHKARHGFRCARTP
jgi:formylglycine-generating enzyme required for sulfatase activity